ncbi:uncharacterized protein LOC127737454 [Mytilus californianus]|uniref:uncharacterized protein LOC127737454 n=1 Tax=Mytilus californianus TaxID=6549 RepID=UPI002245DE16|nr:uncharacterized protein LOC127737454 [Mytilus californianus]
MAIRNIRKFFNLKRRIKCCKTLYFFPLLICILILVIHILEELKNFQNYLSENFMDRGNINNNDNGGELTLITAYFNIGSFKKGPQLIYSQSSYYDWMKSFQSVNNSVILYTDAISLSVQFKLYRAHFPKHMTKVFIVNQRSLWAFQLKSRIEEIYSQPGYPIYYPNVGEPAYSCVMHAKYELMEQVIKEKLFKTKYIAWIDIGYFRRTKPGCFKMEPPKDIRDDHILFSQVDFFKYHLTMTEIIYKSSLFIAGGFFIGRPDNLLLFIEDYKLAVESLLDMNVMNSDQQVLFILYSSKLPFNPRIPIQTFFNPISLKKGRKDRWHFLGKLCQRFIKWKGSGDTCIA